MIGAVKMGVCAIYFLTAASELAMHVTPGAAGDETQGVQPLLGFFFSNSVRTLKSLARTLGPVQTTNRVPPPFCVLLQLFPISVLCDDRHDFDC